MIKVPVIAELADVPLHVVDSLKNMCKNHSEKFIDNIWSDKMKTCDVQDPNSQNLLLDDNDSRNVVSFVQSIMNTAWGFRLHTLIGSSLNGKWVKPHIYPRLIIPIINDKLIYSVRLGEGNTPNMRFNIGKCYIWDFRYPNKSHNFNSDLERTIAIFKFDPNKETIYKGI